VLLRPNVPECVTLRAGIKELSVEDVVAWDVGVNTGGKERPLRLAGAVRLAADGMVVLANGEMAVKENEEKALDCVLGAEKLYPPIAILSVGLAPLDGSLLMADAPADLVASPPDGSDPLVVHDVDVEKDDGGGHRVIQDATAVDASGSADAEADCATLDSPERGKADERAEADGDLEFAPSSEQDVDGRTEGIRVVWVGQGDCVIAPSD
jgi:hypothetical protein